MDCWFHCVTEALYDITQISVLIEHPELEFVLRALIGCEMTAQVWVILRCIFGACVIFDFISM
jgi:hypothetical protein